MKRICAVLAVTVLCASCAPRKAVKGGTGAEGAAAGEGEGPKLSYTKEQDMPEADIREGNFQPAPELAKVYFEYDQYGLTPEAAETLRKNADWLRQHAELKVLVEGHTDEKGTEEYNLALGQKRAQTVREFYARAGIDPTSVGTISYGKERPDCTGQAYDVCGPKNRRAVTLVAPKK